MAALSGGQNRGAAGFPHPRHVEFFRGRFAVADPAGADAPAPEEVVVEVEVEVNDAAVVLDEGRHVPVGGGVLEQRLSVHHGWPPSDNTAGHSLQITSSRFRIVFAIA